MELLRFIDNKDATNVRNKKNVEMLRVGITFSVVFFFYQHTVRPGDTGTWAKKK